MNAGVPAYAIGWMVLPFHETSLYTMKLTRQPRVIAALLALVSMLFMQLVLAGYVCPKASVDASLSAKVTMSTAVSDMPDCDQMDSGQPNLCHASTYGVHQSLDKHELPSVQPFVPAAIALVLVNIVIPASANPFELDTARLSGAPSPPLAIRNCCFRI